MSHDILISKLHYYGVRGIELSLIKSYLSNRRQAVRVGNQISEFLNVTTGVPQGSVLGPFLFLVYVNDFPSFLPYNCVLYADDTTVLTTDKNLTNVQNKNIDMFRMCSTWLKCNRLHLNESKTDVMYFHLNNHMNDLNVCDSVKLLGIHLDPKLNWNVHTENLCRKLSRVLYLLRKLKTVVGEKLLISAYYAFFHSHLLYGILLWGNSAGAQTVFKWQKKAIRVLRGLPDTVSCRPLFKDMQIMTVPSMYIYSCLMYIKENLESFNTRNNFHLYNTRYKDDLNTPHLRLSKTQKSYKYTGMKLYNLLPLTIRAMSYRNFEQYCKFWLISNSVYSVLEFEEKISNETVGQEQM